MPGRNEGITLLVVATLAVFLALDCVSAAPSPMLYKRNPSEKYEAGRINRWSQSLQSLYFALFFPKKRPGARFIDCDPIDCARGELRPGWQAYGWIQGGLPPQAAQTGAAAHRGQWPWHGRDLWGAAAGAIRCRLPYYRWLHKSSIA